MAYATLKDLQERMVYYMSDNERVIAGNLLEDASNKLDLEFARFGKQPNLEDENIEYALVRITCALVARVLSTNVQTDGDYFNNTSMNNFYQNSSFYDGSGMLRLTAEERRELGLPIYRTRAGFASI